MQIYRKYTLLLALHTIVTAVLSELHTSGVGKIREIIEIPPFRRDTPHRTLRY